jgi:hypothetical protein
MLLRKNALKERDSVPNSESSINANLARVNHELRMQKEGEKTSTWNDTARHASQVLVMLLMVVSLTALLFKSGITGQIIGGIGYTTYVQNINANITQTQDTTWMLDEHPASFNLKSVRISGRMTGEGQAKLYLSASNGFRYLVLDENRIQTEGIAKITGHVINVPEGTALATSADERTINTVLEYNTGTNWDSNNDGTAYIEDGVVDLTAASSVFNWQADESKLCTKWTVTSIDSGASTVVCNGAEDCCMLAGVAPESASWNEPLYIHHEKYGATEENLVTAQVVFLNQSIGEETYFESTPGTTASLPVKFVNKPVYEFSGLCVETCTLPDGITDTEYTLEFVLDTGVELHIENITYAVDEIATENAINATISADDTNVSYEKVKTDTRYDAIVDATSYDNSTDTLTVVFHHDSAIRLPISVKGKVDYTLDKNESRAGENVTLAVSNWSDRKFRIVVGSHTEVLEFGEAQQVELDTTIKDASGDKVDATITVVDSIMDETVTENTGRETILEEGEYDINVEFTSMPVKTIELNDVQAYDNATGFIRVSDVAETGNLSEYTEVYAIDPTAVNFTNATVTVTATGTALYKCKEWDFELQQCNGTWEFLQSITPGQEYTFVLTPDDPGLAESNGTFSEGFESGSFTTNNWTLTGVSYNWTVTNTNPYAGTYHAETQPRSTTAPASTLQTTISTVGYQSINLSYYRKLVGIDAADEFKAKWYNGSAWTTVEETLDTSANDASYVYKTFALGSGAANRTDFTIRFECTAGAVSEYCRVDNVSVRSSSVVQIAPTQSTPVLSSSSGTNTTSANLTCYNQSTYDANGDSVKSIFNWQRNSTSITALNMPFEGGSNATYTKDYSGNTNHGTVSGATWNSTGGRDGKGVYRFNGASYIDAGTSSTLLVGTRFTQEAWIYPTISDTNYHGIIGYDPGVTAQRAPSIWIYKQTKIHAGFGNGTTWDGFITGDIITNNAWNHLAVSFDGTTYSVYVNGTLRYNTTNHAGRVPYATHIRNIGRVDNYFNGTIDEVRVYNTALNESQVYSLYSYGAARITSSQLTAGDVWKCAVTPNDGTTDGSTTDSNTATIRAVIDTTPPGTISGLAERSTGTTWIYWNWTNPTDSDFAAAILYRNGTNVANTSNNYYNATRLSPSTTYQLTVRTKDTTGNVNTTNVSDSATTQDGVAPQYSNIRDQNNTAHTPSGNYQFNITWTDNVAVNQVRLEFQGMNYTPSSNGNEYYYSISRLAAGNYTYRWHANDFIGNANQTSTRTFTVAKGTSAVSLILNGTDGNLSTAYPVYINASASRTTGDNTAIYIYRNGTQIASGLSPIYNRTQYTTAAMYNITAYYPETQNYTASSDTHWLTIQDTTPPGTISGLAERSTGTTWIYWNWTNPTDSDFAAAILYRNGTNVANTSNNYYNATRLSPSTTYQLTVRTKDTTGNVNTTNVSDSATTQDGVAPQYSNIRDQNNTAHTPSGNYQFNITWTDNVAVNEVTFEFNGINYTNPTKTGDLYYISMSNLAAGSYSYRWHANDFFSNTNSTGTRTFTVAKGTPAVNIDCTGGWSKTYGTASSVNCSSSTAGVSVSLYRNSTPVSNPDMQTLGANTYTYTCNTTENLNYTTTSTANNLTISRASSAITIKINGSSANTTIERLASANLTATTTTGDNVAVSIYRNGSQIASGTSPLQNISAYSSWSDYNITAVYSESQNYSASSATAWLFVRDTRAPGTASGLAETNRGSSWILWSWTNPSDADFGEAILYVNWTNVANTSSNSYNVTGLATYNTYQLTINTKDSYGNVNNTAVSDTAITLDELPPTYSGISDQNSTVYSPGGSYQFNSTWTDNVGVSAVRLEFEGANYTPSSDGNTYYTTLSDISAGSHSYRWHASDTAGNSNSTGYFTFVIEKAATTMTINASPTWNETYGTETTVSCSASNGEATPTLFRNGTSTGTPDIQTLAAGSYGYVCNASATQNYSAATTGSTLTINKAVPTVNLLLNESSTNRTVEVGSYVNETIIHTSAQMLEIYEQGVMVASGSSPLTKLTQYNSTGTFNVTAVHPENENMTAAEETLWLTVQDSTAPTVTLISPSDGYAVASQTYTFEFNFTDNYYSTADCSLYVNGTLSGINSSAAEGTTIRITNTSLPEGHNMWSINCTDPSGNSGTSPERNLTVDVTAPTIEEIIPEQGDIVGYNAFIDVHSADEVAGIHTTWYEIRNSSGSPVISGSSASDDLHEFWNTTTVADGNYTLTAYANDTLGNMANASVSFTVSNTLPYIHILEPEYDNAQYNSNFNLDITYQDDYLKTASYNITNSTGYAVQSGQHEMANMTRHQFTELVNVSALSDGNYTINAYANDSTGYATTETRQFIIDKTAPTYSNLEEPTDPSTYSPGVAYTFNSTWSADTSASSVKFEINGTNYTTTKNGDTYSKTMTPLAGGTYAYRWHASDTAGNWNSTETQTFTVSPATAICLLSFDKSSPQQYGTELTANCSCSGNAVWRKMWRNSTDVTGEMNTEVELAASDYAYECNRTATRNYTSASDTGTFTISKIAPTTTLSALPSWNNTYGTETTITCGATNATLTPEMYRDGSLLASPHTTTAAAGTYNYTCTVAEDQNRTSATSSRTLTINKTSSALTLTLNGSAANLTIERTSDAAIDAARITGEGSIYLYRNGTLLGSGTSASDTSTYNTAGRYNITAAYPETQNYTASSRTLWLNVSDTVAPDTVTDLVMLNRGQNYIYWVWTNPTDPDFYRTEIYLNNTYKTLTSNEYYYATGLNHSTQYQISVRAVDTSGTIGAWVNDTQRTDYNCTENWVAQYTNCSLNDTRVKYYTDSANCGISYTLPADNGTTTSCDCVVSTNFDGNTTNFTRSSFNSISNIVLESSGTGKIRFLEPITLSRCVDLDTYTAIGTRYVRVDSKLISEFNRSAEITVENVSYINPIVTVNGTECNSSTCTDVSYDNSTFVFNVTHFTQYTVEEGPYCGDGSCNGDETSATCLADCPAYAGVGGGGGRGGGGGGSNRKEKACEPNWLCYSWNPCTEYLQNRKCFDTNGCGTEEGLPELERTCTIGCAERWACGEWGKCTEAGVQTRACNDLAKCGSETRKPLTVQPCEYDFCTDGKQNNGESGVDCGGSCRDCTREELQEAEMKKNLLTGEAITVAPYEPPNPLYLMPLLFMLMLLIAVIALHKANLSEKMKRVLAAMHIMLIISILVMLLMTFNVPQTTGRAVIEMAENAGLSSTILAVIVSALLLGGMAYVAISKSVPDMAGLESFYMRSKYWAGIAVQNFAWKATRKKMKQEIKLDIPAKFTGPTKESAKPTAETKTADTNATATKGDPEQTLFSNIMKGVKDIDFKVGELEQEIAELRAQKAATAKTPETPKQSKTEERKTEAANPDVQKQAAVTTQAAPIRQAEAAKQPVAVARPTAAVKAAPIKPATMARTAPAIRPAATKPAPASKPAAVTRPVVSAKSAPAVKPAAKP